MKYTKLMLSIPLSAGLLLAGCGTDEQEPPPETEDVELEQNEMEENHTENNEMQDPGTTEDPEMQDPGTTEDPEMQDPNMNEETPSGEDGTGGADQETNMDTNEGSEED
ncbi:hypothetical protein J7I93_15920 [Bacillus sp. ISL-47]|uniref:hypothetical protein n=1 Tax=Bacillus sp. ISL-47 TaxID=2819130 RepID=UPI001BE70556|nr:hypothetical protein [Bacillus sp. ISL-47]MBT2689675.1 hypothetical protein [Bacillus sp. ISL-47]MBT2709321.1 hypothetical protein [Pseudomonas sp. ISL-84]